MNEVVITSGVKEIQLLTKYITVAARVSHSDCGRAEGSSSSEIDKGYEVVLFKV